jgi:hypothetical protein
VNGDIRNRWLIAWSGRTAGKWLDLFWPGPTPQQQRVRRRKYRSGRSGSGGLADYVQHLLLLPLFGFALAFTSFYRAIVTRAGHRAEYRADRMGSLAGGTDAMARALDVLWVADILASSLTSAARRGDSDLLGSLPSALAAIPPRERERLRRRAASRMQRVDDQHPPTAFRAAYLASATRRYGADADSQLVAAADAELRRASTTVEKSLRARVGTREGGGK